MTVPSTPVATSGAAGRGCASFTESSGIVPDFPWAEAGEAKVHPLLLVLIGGILPPGGSRRWLVSWKARVSCPTFLGQKQAKPRFARFCWC